MPRPESPSAMAGPQLRSPSGGNFVKRAKARASSTVLTIGAMMPEAPQSSTRDAVAKSPTGMRTSAGCPATAPARRPDGAGDIDRAVLHVERDAIDAFAGDDARDQRIGDADPAREKARSAPHALREGGEGWIGHGIPPDAPDSPPGGINPGAAWPAGDLCHTRVGHAEGASGAPGAGGVPGGKWLAWGRWPGASPRESHSSREPCPAGELS